MLAVNLKCPICGSENISKNGRTRQGTQQYLCKNKECKKTTFMLEYQKNGSKPEVKKQIIHMAMNGSGIRDTARVLKVSINTVLSELKKRKSTQPNQCKFVKKYKECKPNKSGHHPF